jgi:hypothetical protein
MSRVQCVICKKSVKLEDCKCNEFGQAVHEDCYVRMLIEKKQQQVTEVYLLLGKYAKAEKSTADAMKLLHQLCGSLELAEDRLAS